MVKAILFDYGGTLDTGARHWSYVLHEGYEAAGISLPQPLFREAYVYGERALARTPIIEPDDNFRRLLEKKVRQEVYFLQQAGYEPLSDEARVQSAVGEVAAYCDGYARRCTARSSEVLSLLHGRYPLAVVSNFYGNLPVVLADYGLSRFFGFVVESAVVGVRKPDPQIFTLAVERLGIPASEVLVVGDSFSKDIVPARQAGCQTVWFKGEEWEAKQYDESLPTHVITSLAQLPDCL